MGKKVGILTFHYVYSYGGVLQAYALRKVINSFPNCHAEIINYVPKGCYYPVFTDNMKSLERKREKFNHFLSVQCGIQTAMFHSLAEENIYDAYIVGSDMIWNTDFQEVTEDYAYFLPNLDDRANKIAYSASIGIEPDKIDKALFKRYLSRFNAISLREKSYVKPISQIADKECEYTLDPTLLLDGIHYEMLIEKPEVMENSDIPEEPYALFLWYDRGDGCGRGIETVNAIARKYGLKIKHTFLSEDSVTRQMLARDGGCMSQAGIGEFLWYVKHAAVVVTNSFHGAIFSILFERPLYICYQEPWKCRQENLATLFCLEDRTVQGYLSPDKFSLEMSYEKVFRILERERKRSLSYLKTALGIT